MDRSFSVYLDLVRFSAAFLVYLWHSNQRFLIESPLPAASYGHSSVIVFFVLSGLVIAYVTDAKESTLPKYMASRVSRVFSVVIPTVVLTLLLDAIGRQLYPQIYEAYPFDQFLTRLIGSLLMGNEVWLISITSFSNVPYWSICYEWWYYVTFAMTVFLRPSVGLPLAALTMIALGPKLILLAPAWWAGVLLYRSRAGANLSLVAAYLMVVGSVIGIVVFHVLDVQNVWAEVLRGWIGERLVHELTFTKYFLSDYVLTALVFANFAGMRRVAPHLQVLFGAIEKPVQFLAGYTFTLYLLHQPIFLFWGAIVRGDPQTSWFWLTVTLLTMLSIWLVGHVTEIRRYSLRAWLLPILERLHTSTGLSRISATLQTVRAPIVRG